MVTPTLTPQRLAQAAAISNPSKPVPQIPRSGMGRRIILPVLLTLTGTIYATTRSDLVPILTIQNRSSSTSPQQQHTSSLSSSSSSSSTTQQQSRARNVDPLQQRNMMLMDSYGDKGSLEDLQRAVEEYGRR